MGTDETIEKIYDRQDRHRDEILGAIGEVKRDVSVIAVDTATTKATVVGLDARMAVNEKQNDKRDKRMDKIESRLWKVAGAGGVTGTFAAILLRVVWG